MKLAEYRELDHQQYYNEGWNAAATAWEYDAPLNNPQTEYTGDRRESFLEGYRACQDYILLNDKAKP